jgi:hypothetical protein
MTWGLVVLLAPCVAAWAQERIPHVGYTYPAGGRQGTTFLVTVGGQYLDDLRQVRFSGSGIQATVRKDIRPLTMQEMRELQETLNKLRMQGFRDAENVKKMYEVQKKLIRAQEEVFRRQAQPAIGEMVTLQVTLAQDAELGQHELRLETSRGISNPLVFCVGRLPEFREKEPETSVDPRDFFRDVIRRGPKTETPITLPAVVNGQIIPRDPDRLYFSPDRFTPGDVDRYRFEARKGQQLVIAARARALIPYLADAVPGWFQATLTLYDARGKELAFNDDYRFHPDPVLFFKVPEDGQYVVEIKDAIYRGRPDFVYRITIGEFPFVTGIFPFGGRAGAQTSVELKGWNLPTDKLTMDTRNKAPGIYPLSVRRADMTSNRVPFAIDSLPECLEQEANDSLPNAQPVVLGVIVNGRIDRPGDRDVFRFEGRAGAQVIAEVQARRLDSPLDSVLLLTDAAGKRLAFNDDHEDKGDGLGTHHADSLIHFTLPSTGTYYLHLSDAQHEGGPEYSYRLRISAPRPDFALRIAPSRIHARAGRFVPISVFVLRKDGFAGAIALDVKDAPEGFVLRGGLVPAGQDQVRVTLMVPPIFSEEPIPLGMEGRATIGGQEVVHSAVPADDMMQAFAYKHLVPAQDLKVAIVDNFRFQGRPRDWERGPGGQRRPYPEPMKLLGEQPVAIPVGGSTEVRVVGPPLGGGSAEVRVELSDPPAGFSVKSVSRIDRGLAIVLSCDADKARPGLKGNLIANVFQVWTRTEKDGRTRTNRWLMAILPAIPFEVVKAPEPARP